MSRAAVCGTMAWVRMPKSAVTIERRYDAPAELVWALLTDTNRFDRALGLGFASYRWETIDGRRVHVARARQNGVEMEWIEPPYEWIEGRMLEGARQFLAGPAKTGGMRMEVEPDGDGARARVTVSGSSTQWYMRLLNPLVRAHLAGRTRAYLEAIAELLRGPALARVTAETPGVRPPAERVAALLDDGSKPALSGGHTPVDHAELERRAERLRSYELPGAASERLIAWLRERPDEDVAQMQPFARARGWGLDRREVLRTFLHATRAGLVDLNWQINCPVCRVSAAVEDSLEKLGRQVHCEACNIRYDVDFGRSVEAVFRCNAAVRPVTPGVFCAASPALRPHVIAQLRVEPGAVRDAVLPLADGHLLLRTLGAQRPAVLEAAVAPASLSVVLRPGEVECTATGASSDGTTALRVTSALDEPAYVSVERGAWSCDAVLGSVIATLPEFVELFATEAPAAGLELSVGRLVLLFSDLTGSTALYERVGDARAFAIVQAHFRSMERCATAHDGTVVKTMGDAVMVSFSRIEDAVAAGIAMVAATNDEHGGEGISVKIGIHEGPCLAVRANDRLDFFGTTVNVAARLQAQAGPSELVLARETAAHPASAQLLRSFGMRRFRASLKGIAAEQELLGFDLRAPVAGAMERASGDET